MRRVLGLVCCCGLVGLSASSSSATVGESEGEQVRRTFTVSVPSVGDVTVAGVLVRAASKKGKLVRPRLGVIKTGLPKGVAVVGGLLPHPKIKRAWIASVALLRPNARKTSSVAPTSTVRFTIVGDVGPGLQCSEADNLLARDGAASGARGSFFTRTCATAPYSRYCSDIGTRNLAMGYLALVLDDSPRTVGGAARDLACHRAGVHDPRFVLKVLLGLSSEPSPTPAPTPAPALSCTAPLHDAGTAEIQGILTCDRDIGGFDFTPGTTPAGPPDIVAWLPSSAGCDGKTIHYRGAIPANTAFPFNVRTTPPPGPGGTLVVFDTGGNDVLTFTPTGP